MRLTATSLVGLLSVLAGSAQAQGRLPLGLIGGISTGCLGGLASLLGNVELNNCLAITSVVTQLGGVGQNESLVPAINTYISESLCPAPVCTDSALASANNTITTACASDIESDESFLPGLLQLILGQYTAIKTASCLQDTNASNQVCVTQTLNAVQSTLGQNLSLAEVQSLTNGSTLPALLNRLQANTTAFCTDCNRGVLLTLQPALASYLNASTLQRLQSAITDGCGVNFLAPGDIPGTLRQTGNLNGSSGSGSGGGSNGVATTKVAPILASIGALVAVGLALVL